MKPISKETNRKTIIIYYLFALILVIIGIYKEEPLLYVVAIVLLALGLFRKRWLMKRLKK